MRDRDRYDAVMSRTPSRPTNGPLSAGGGQPAFDGEALLRALEEDAAEERQHLLRDGIAGLAIGLLAPFLAFGLCIVVFRIIPGLRRTSILPIIGVAIAVVYLVALVWSWWHVRPFAVVERRSQDPRYGRPKVKANEADDERYEDSTLSWSWELIFWSPSFLADLASMGSRQAVQGIRSLIDRSRLGSDRLRTAAALLQGTAGEGLLSQSIPDDTETYHALLFLWRHHHLQSEGTLTRCRLLPSEKGLRTLNGARLGTKVR